MLAIGMLAAAAGVVLGLRFSLITLLLLLFGCLLAAHLPVRAEIPSEHCKCGVVGTHSCAGTLRSLGQGDEMPFRMGRSGRRRRCKKATATSYLTSKPIQAALIVIVGERRA